MGSVLHQIPELQRRLANTEEQGKILSSEMPEHHATIEMGLQQLYDKWKNLNDEIGERNDKLRSAKEYFELIERTEKFLKDANKNLLDWSKRLSFDGSSEDNINNMITMIEHYITKHRSEQNEILVRMTAAAGQVFGPTAFQKTKLVQKEQDDTFAALNSLISEAKDASTKLKIVEVEKLRAVTPSTVTHQTQTESDSPPPRPPLPIFIQTIEPPPQGL